MRPHDTDTERAAQLLDETRRNVAAYVQRYLDRFGAWLNADNASELFPEYSVSPEARQRLFLIVRPSAGVIVEGAFARLLGESVSPERRPIATFTAGGNGAGKSTSVDLDADGVIVFDSTLSQLAPSLGKIDQALTAGLHVHVRYLFRDPLEAWAEGVLPRAMDPNSREPGRPVRLAGHVQTHIGARNTAIDLRAHYQCDPRVKFQIFENRTGRSLEARSLEWLEAKESPVSDVLKAQLRAVLDEQLADGRISPGFFDSARGR